MKFFLEKIFFINRAPLEDIQFDFEENEIAILSAINGRGKTTILSYIADAFYELAKKGFPNEFEGKSNKYYRVTSPLYSFNNTEPSFVYLRFKVSNSIIDYIDINGKCTEEQYNNKINLVDKVTFNQFAHIINQEGQVKFISNTFSPKQAAQLFYNNVIAYFPSYRFEIPGYLNEPYKMSIDFKKYSDFTGYLPNPIEIITGLPQLTNWIMDVILDMQYKNIENQTLKDNIDAIITDALSAKCKNPLRFGVGPRRYGSTRIQIVNKANEESIYPSIFNLSSGESSILCLFGEILKHADKVKENIALGDISGIVLIDEIDKHLHIGLQKEVLPKLLNLFPKIQFIISSHSPFLNMGLAEIVAQRSKIIDMDNLGISKTPTSNSLYDEVYQLMIEENKRFKSLHDQLSEKLKFSTKPLLITEGETDIKHLKKARKELGIEDDVEYFNGNSSSKLKTLLENISKIPHERKIIGIFDRDEPKIIQEIEENSQPFKKYGNNVYAFCIPQPQLRENYQNISIEFYYTDEALKTKQNNKCLYFNNELHFDSNRTPTSIREIVLDDKYKKIWDENIGNLNWIHSKSVFAKLVEENDIFSKEFDFSNFNLIFNKIKTILNHT